MTGVNVRRMRSSSLAGLLVLWPVLAHATVYSWRGEGGVLMMTNNPEDVPEDKRASVQTFTSKPAPKRARREEAIPDARSGEAALDAYERGFERGRRAAEREVAFAERLAASVPQAPPVPIIIEQPAPPPAYDDYPAPAAFYDPYTYGPYTPYPPYLLGYNTFGFGGRFGPHRHVFGGTRARGRRFGRPFSRTTIGRMR